MQLDTVVSECTMLRSNFTNWEQEAVPRTPAEIGFQVFVLIFLCIATITGNALVAAVVYYNRPLHRPTYYFITNLSMADFMVAAIYVPFYADAVLKQAWDYSLAWCRGHYVTISLSFNESLITLSLVSLDRFMAITRPLRYQCTLTSRRALIMVTVSWLHSFLWAVPPVIGWGEIVYDNSTNTCRTSWGASGLGNKLYAVLLGLFAFVAPTVVLIFCYVKIFIVARHQVKSIRKATVQVQTNENPSAKPSKSIDVSESKALKTVLLVLGAFVVAWLPYSVVSVGKLVTRGSWDVDASWANAVLTVTLLNGCLNPFIYAVKDSRFREGLIKLWTGVKVSHPDVYNSSRAASIEPRSLHDTVPNNDAALASFKCTEN